jgi:hypothetical protein
MIRPRPQMSAGAVGAGAAQGPTPGVKNLGVSRFAVELGGAEHQPPVHYE